jgi:FtsZ-binding cell division protein ZapB
MHAPSGAAAAVINRLTTEIDELHCKCNALKRSLGQAPAQPESEAKQVKQQHARPEEALKALRDAKAAELQMLTLRQCGASTRHCHGSSSRSGPGDRFNLQLLYSMCDCLQQQQKALKAHAERQESLQRENRELRGVGRRPASAAPSGAWADTANGGAATGNGGSVNVACRSRPASAAASR